MSETPFTHVHAAVWVAIPGAIFIFLLDDHHDVEEALHGVEWDTLIFFAALFVMVEGLAEMGLLRLIGGTLATAIAHLDPETRQVYAIILVRWHSLYTHASYNSQLLAPQLPQLQLWLTWFPRSSPPDTKSDAFVFNVALADMLCISGDFSVRRQHSFHHHNDPSDCTLTFPRSLPTADDLHF